MHGQGDWAAGGGAGSGELNKSTHRTHGRQVHGVAWGYLAENMSQMNTSVCVCVAEITGDLFSLLEWPGLFAWRGQLKHMASKFDSSYGFRKSAKDLLTSTSLCQEL